MNAWKLCISAPLIHDGAFEKGGSNVQHSTLTVSPGTLNDVMYTVPHHSTSNPLIGLLAQYVK